MLKREKRFLLLMREYVLGGAETQFRYLIEYAEKQNWKLDVLIEHDLNKDDDTLKKAKAAMNNVRFYELRGGREYGKLSGSVIQYLLKSFVHTKYSACIIYHPLDLVIAPFMRIMGIHVIYSERVDAAGIAESQYLQSCLRFCNCILANSMYAKMELEKMTGRKVMLIRNGKPVVSQVPEKKERKIRRILLPARIIPAKNQMLLLYYLKEHPDFTGKLVLAGWEEDKAYQQKIERFIGKNNLQERVEFLGHVEKMENEYEKADLVILPSLAEGTPNVVLEAYAYGRPVIVSDIGMERDLVTDPRLRFGVKSLKEIDDCIKYVESLSDDSYIQMIEENRRVVLRDYNITKMAKRFYTVLLKC